MGSGLYSRSFKKWMEVGLSLPMWVDQENSPQEFAMVKIQVWPLLVEAKNQEFKFKKKEKKKENLIT